MSGSTRVTSSPTACLWIVGLVLALVLGCGHRRPSPDQLSRAAYRGDLAELDRLLAAGAMPNGRDHTGEVPLAIAIIGQQPAAALRLLEAGADPRGLDRFKESMLTGAVSAAAGSTTIVEALLDRGADPRALTRLGLTQLGIAAGNDDLAVVTLLLDRGVAIDVEDRFHVVALDCAARSGAVHSATLLLDRGADVNRHVPEQTSAGATPLHLAAENGHVEMVRLLLARGADRGALDETGRTPGQLAVINQHADVAAALAEP